jgi:phage/plasmid primase-like uncharacterized protein
MWWDVYADGKKKMMKQRRNNGAKKKKGWREKRFFCSQSGVLNTGQVQISTGVNIVPSLSLF